MANLQSAKSSPAGKYGSEEKKLAFRTALKTKGPPIPKELYSAGLFDADIRTVIVNSAESLVERKNPLLKKIEHDSAESRDSSNTEEDKAG